jgi:transcriptional regulator with XRE-family HTH domain
MTNGTSHIVEFGREVRRRREALHMTLEQFAKRSGLTPNYIGTIENGKRDPSLTTVIALAKGLGIEPAALFGALPDLSPAGEEAGHLFDASPPDLQTPLLALLRASAAKRRRGG